MAQRAYCTMLLLLLTARQPLLSHFDPPSFKLRLGLVLFWTMASSNRHFVITDGCHLQFINPSEDEDEGDEQASKRICQISFLGAEELRTLLRAVTEVQGPNLSSLGD
ncbi:hypothetical protein L208DRAFT_1407691 [Tricholoma matsutake]|nr:hypothetical protein L208DRAFT_1407691 [Tricholoma matsutake 945]